MPTSDRSWKTPPPEQQRPADTILGPVVDRAKGKTVVAVIDRPEHVPLVRVAR